MRLRLNKQKLFLFIIVIAFFEVPKLTIEIFSLPVPYFFGGNPPWLLPIILFFLILNIYKSKLKIEFKTEDFLIIFTLFTWLTLYIYHNDFIGGGWRSWNGAVLITTNLWMYIGYLLLKTSKHLENFYYSLINQSITILSIIASIFLLLIFIDYLFPLPIIEKIQNNNGLAVRLSVGVFLILFFNESFSKLSKLFLLIPSCLFIFYSESRGCIAIIIILFLYKLLISLKPKGFRQIVYILLLLIIPAFSIQIAEFIGIQIYKLTKGLDLLSGYYLHAEGYHFESNVVSAYTRIRTNILLLQEFINNPLLGIGFQNTMNIKIFGYISHTYYLYPLVSYGILGTLPYFLFFFYFVIKGVKWNLKATIIFMIFLILIFTFLNDMVLWLAILLFIINKENILNSKKIRE